MVVVYDQAMDCKLGGRLLHSLSQLSVLGIWIME